MYAPISAAVPDMDATAVLSASTLAAWLAPLFEFRPEYRARVSRTEPNVAPSERGRTADTNQACVPFRHNPRSLSAPRPRSGAGISRFFTHAFELHFASPCRISGHFRRRLPHLADSFERRDARAGDGLKLRLEFCRVVGDQFRPVARPADLDINGLLRGELEMVGLERGDDGVDRTAVEGMHGRNLQSRPERGRCGSAADRRRSCRA